jgi:hypothetical protein
MPMLALMGTWLGAIASGTGATTVGSGLGCGGGESFISVSLWVACRTTEKSVDANGCQWGGVGSSKQGPE